MLVLLLPILEEVWLKGLLDIGTLFLFQVAWNNVFGRERPVLEDSQWGSRAGILTFLWAAHKVPCV